jgi:hypothetical protein
MFRTSIVAWLLLAAAAAVAVSVSVHCLRQRPFEEGRRGASLVIPPPPDGAVYLKRTESKRRLAREAAVGRTPLLRAAAAFKELDALEPRIPLEGVTYQFPNASMEECYCRMVIERVRLELPAGEAEDAVCRLEAELYARLREGPLVLPDGP